MATPEQPEIRSYGVDDKPGVRIDFGDDEYAIAQQLVNGFVFAWSTDKEAAEAIADYTAMGSEGMSTTYLPEGSSTVKEAEGDHIVSDLQVLGDGCRFAKLRKTGREDYVVFNSRILSETGRNDISVMGPFLGSDETERIATIRAAIEASATPAVLNEIDWILERVVGIVTAEAA